MGWFEKFMARWRWSYVGTVDGYTRVVSEETKEPTGIEYRGYWVLSERGDGKRKVRLGGDPGESAYARNQRALVEAWKHGGPLPSLHDSPAPPKSKAKLIVFQGGKPAA